MSSDETLSEKTDETANNQSQNATQTAEQPPEDVASQGADPTVNPPLHPDSDSAPENQPVAEQVSQQQLQPASEQAQPTQPAAQTEAAASAEIQPVSELVAPSGDQEKNRPRLNPSRSGSSKAMPTLSESDVEPPSSHRQPVEIPRKDEDIESQLAAVMNSQEASLETAAQPDAEVVISVPENFPTEDTLEPGTPLKGKVQSVHGESVFLDLGYRSPGVIQARQFNGNLPEVGQALDVSVDRYSADEGLIYASLPKAVRKVSGDWDAITVNQTVECMVEKVIKGGLEVTVGSLRGFMPASQVDVKFVNDLEQFVGQKLQAVVTQANPKRKNLVLSHRRILERDREEAAEMIWIKLEEGQVFDGVVKTLKDYGAFVDIGGVDAFLHIGQISWNRINHPSEVLEPGQEIQVKVIALDRETKKISLGMKQLNENPWSKIEDKYAQGTTVSGKVIKVTEFGAFVELEPTIEALCHISQLAYRRVNKVTEVLKVGETYDFQVVEVAAKKKRISLSFKALQPEPEKPDRKKKEDDIPQATEPYTRKRSGPLKGGKTSAESSGGGLFGNPDDFS